MPVHDWTREFLLGGAHLLVVDLFPPGPRDPEGIHNAIWDRFSDDDFRLPDEARLTLASYAGGPFVEAFVNTSKVGAVLPDMPLFLTTERYVSVPMENAYMSAWEAVPTIWREAVDG